MLKKTPPYACNYELVESRRNHGCPCLHGCKERKPSSNHFCKSFQCIKHQNRLLSDPPKSMGQGTRSSDRKEQDQVPNPAKQARIACADSKMPLKATSLDTVTPVSIFLTNRSALIDIRTPAPDNQQAQPSGPLPSICGMSGRVPAIHCPKIELSQ